jgi:hypothetical protein
MLRPLASFRESILVRSRKWFVIDGCVRDRAGDGIEETFEHTDRGGHLVRGKVLDQFVGVLFICRHNTVILYREVWPAYSFAVASPNDPAYDSPMAKAKKFDMEAPAPIWKAGACSRLTAKKPTAS